MRAFAASTGPGEALSAGREEACGRIGRTLRRFAYWRLGKAEKGLLKRCLERSPGLSRAQAGRLLKRCLEQGEMADRRGGSAQPLRKRYRREDIVQLAETDELHGRLSGSAAWALLRRAWDVFGDMRYERLAGLSNGHLSQPAAAARLWAPDGAQGRPGCLWADSAHQGDRDKVKGADHLNAIDEVTQYPFAGSVERINRELLSPYLHSHRPCCFQHTLTDDKGRQRKLYRQANLQTPYEKLKPLPDAEIYLRAGVSFAELRTSA